MESSLLSSDRTSEMARTAAVWQRVSRFSIVYLGDLSGLTDLLVYNGTEAGFTLHNGVWDAHLSAESWEEDNELDWVHIIWNQYERWLLGLDEGDDVVEAVFHGERLLADVLLLLALALGRGLLGQALLLLGLGLWSVLVEELEHLSGSVAVECVAELRDRWWDLETHVQDLTLALKSDISWPLHHTRQVATWLNVLTNAIVSWSSLDERVLQHVRKLRRLPSDEHSPWPASCSCQPLHQEMVLEQLSCQSLEAIIEKNS